MKIQYTYKNARAKPVPYIFKKMYYFLHTSPAFVLTVPFQYSVPEITLLQKTIKIVILLLLLFTVFNMAT